MVRALFGVTRPAPRRPAFHWAAVAVWSATIFAVIPLARPLQVTVTASIGRAAFTVVALAVAAAVGVAAVHAAWRAGPEGRVLRLCVLGAVGVTYTWFSLSLRASPEEALHFVQYGVLALLVFRALSLRFGDASVYAAALAVCVIVGAVDEVVQWLTPDRWFGFKDIGLNTLGASLALVAIGLGIQPDYIRRRPAPTALRVSLRLWAVTLTALLLLSLHTPWVVEQYTSVIAALDGLRTNRSVVAEYGHRHSVDGLVFWSRLGTDELRRLDAARASTLGDDLASRRSGGDLDARLAVHRRGTDAFAFEVTKRLAVRNASLKNAADADTDEEEQALLEKAAIENAVLERFAPETLTASDHGLSAAEQARLQAAVGTRPTGTSKVESHLLTAPVHRFVPAVLALAVLALGVVDLLIGRRARHRSELHSSAPSPTG